MTPFPSVNEHLMKALRKYQSGTAECGKWRSHKVYLVSKAI